MASISLEHIKKTYEDGVTVIPDLNLEIRDREFLILVGPSGCGKSTTLRMIAGLEDISGGTLKIGDRVVNDLPPKDRDIAMVFQSYALYPHMTVYKNMAFGLQLRRVPKAEIDRKVRTAAQALELTAYLDRRPRALSGGQRQRVALGRAMVRDPAVFLLDEPLSNLDAKLRTEMRARIAELHRELGTTFVYVTHDQTEAMTMADRIVVMLDGKIQQADTPEQLYAHPCNVFVAGFIGVSNFVECDVKGDDPGKAVLDIKGECSIICTLKKPFNGKGIISARPEQLFFDDKEGLPGTIIISTFLGDFIEYEILLDNGQTVQLNEYTKDVHELRPDGEKVKVNFDIRAVGVYDAATQEVISW